MTDAERRFFIKRALMRTLEDCGNYAATDSAVRASVGIKIDHLSPTTAEIDEQLRVIDRDRLAVSLQSERGPKYKITDAGRLWLAENP
jgi:hypothetical protein